MDYLFPKVRVLVSVLSWSELKKPLQLKMLPLEDLGDGGLGYFNGAFKVHPHST